MGYLKGADIQAEKARKLQLSGIWALPVSALSTEKIESLRNKGWRVMEASKGFPFLEVAPAQREKLNPGKIQALMKAKDQVISLDLSQTPVTNQMLREVGKLKHLSSCRLDQTTITDEGISHLENLKFLEVLNLRGTKVSDKGLLSLASLPTLKRVYLWETAVTPTGIDSLRARTHDLEIIQGEQALEVFGGSQLSTPSILAEQEIFMESTQVALALDLPGIDLYYTLDGSIPDSGSLRYMDPFSIDHSATINAIALKEGWEASEVATKEVTRLSGRIHSFALSHPPSEAYPGKGPNSLIDMKKGTQDFRGDAWLGFEGKNLVATVGFEKERDINRVTLSCLEDIGSWIFFPVSLKVEVSSDGESFRQAGFREFAAASGMTEPSRKHFGVSLSPGVAARFIRVTGVNIGKNPYWHPSPGGKSWLFADEVLIE